MRKRLQRLGRLAVVDVTPLREAPGYRWLFAGMFFVQAGRQLLVVAVPVQVYALTGSTLQVGLLGLAQLIPLLTVSLVGGALADAFDRKRLLVIAQVTLAATAAGLFWNSVATNPAVWPLFVLVGVNAGVSAIDHPSRQALLPGLVGRRLLPSALAMNQTLSNTAKAAIPAVGGLLIAGAGLAPTYAVAVVMFVVGAGLMWRTPNVPTEGGGRKMGWSSIAEGLAFLKSRRLIQAAMLIDLNAMVFGMPTALFPAFGTAVLGGDAFTVGLLYAAPGAGALVGALTSGWVATVRRQGRAVILSVIVWGLAMTALGFTTSVMFALAMLAFAGWADVVSAILRQAIIQLSVPDHLRGRLSSIHVAAAGGGPRLGDLEAGVVAELTSVRISVISGGIACVLGAVALARWSPGFRNYVYDPGQPDPPGQAQT